MLYETLEKLAETLQKRNIRYMLIGGQAVLLYGEPRLTKDIDITVDCTPDNLPDILDAAHELDLRPLVDPPGDFVKKTLVLPCMNPETGIRVDFIFSNSPYEKQAFDRVKRVVIGSTEVSFISVEDLIIHKIVAGRPRDIDDVQRILLKNSGIDADYIRFWLTKFDESLSQSFLSRFDELRKS